MLFLLVAAFVLFLKPLAQGKRNVFKVIDRQLIGAKTPLIVEDECTGFQCLQPLKKPPSSVLGPNDQHLYSENISSHKGIRGLGEIVTFKTVMRLWQYGGLF